MTSEKSWNLVASVGMSRSFAQTLPASELCEYVIAVAQFQLEWMLESFTIPMSEWGDETQRLMALRFWPSAAKYPLKLQDNPTRRTGAAVDQYQL